MDDEERWWNRLHVFEMTCLRRILGVTRLDKICNKVKESLFLDQDVLRVVVKRFKYFGQINKIQNT